QNRSRRNQCLKVPGKPTLDRSLKTRHSWKTVNQVKDIFFADANRGMSRRGSVWMRSRSTVSTKVTSPLGEDDPHRGHLAHDRGRPSPRSPRPWAGTTRAEATSPIGEDDPRRGHLSHGRGRPAPSHLAHGRGRPVPRSTHPWTRMTRAKVTSPMSEDDPRRGNLAHGRVRPAPGSPLPWVRTTRAEVTSPMGEDDPHRGHLANGRGPISRPKTVHPRPSSRKTILGPLDAIPMNVEKRISLDEVSFVSEDRLNQGHLAHGGGRPAPRSPRPWARTTRAEVTSPMGEDDPRRGHLAHGRGPTSRPENVHPRLSSRNTILGLLDAIPMSRLT
ncbi:LOW QUALITY PROTEIN: hypothetical protein HID58_059567, partial [Brassica napus]